jgi:hypothetical protein
LVANTLDILLNTSMTSEREPQQELNEKEILEANIVALQKSTGSYRERIITKVGFAFLNTSFGSAGVESAINGGSLQTRIIETVLGVAALYGALHFGRKAFDDLDSYTWKKEDIAVDQYKLDQLRDPDIDMPKAPLFEQELNIFNEHLPSWQAKGIGGFALIKGVEFRGTFETENDAIDVGYKTFGNVPFLVKPIVEVVPIDKINQNSLN